jgi:plastocyanin
MKLSRTQKIFLYYIVPPVFLVVAIVLVIFFYLQFHKPVEMDVTSSGFRLGTIEIKEGETVHFVNHSNVVQVLCLGQNKVCDTHAVAPATLKNPGIRLNPGASTDVVFDRYGTFVITSTTMPGVNLKITVDPAG